MINKSKSVEELLRMAESNSEDSGEGDIASVLSGNKAQEQSRQNTTEEIKPIKEPEYKENKQPSWNEVTTKEEVLKTQFKPIQRDLVDINIINRILMGAEYYSSLSSTEKNIIASFLEVTKEEHNVSNIIYKGLYLENNKIDYMNLVYKLYNTDEMERPWIMMAMDNDTLFGVSGTINSLLGKEAFRHQIDSEKDRINFLRQLQFAIAGLDEKLITNMSYIINFINKVKGTEND